MCCIVNMSGSGVKIVKSKKGHYSIFFDNYFSFSFIQNHLLSNNIKRHHTGHFLSLYVAYYFFFLILTSTFLNCAIVCTL